jgi:drug/metabolite transporter (DMT)-like permease
VPAVLLALAGAASWGVGDFLGGLAARRAHVLAVLALSQLVGLAGAAVWVAVSGDAWPGPDDALPAAGAGLAGAVGLAALYRGLAIGAMGIVAPISAASPVVPLAVDAARGDVPSPLQWLGIATVLAGILILSRERGSARAGSVSAGVGLALVAALGFGLFVVGIDASADASVPWAVTTARLGSSCLAVVLVLLAGAPRRVPRPVVPLVLAVGVFDTGANVLVAAATTKTLAGVVAVLSALYPVATIALARLVLGERLDTVRRVGAVAALAGATLVAAG